MGGVDFSSLFLNLSGVHYDSLMSAKAAGAAVISYGLFFNTVLNFIIVAVAMFSLIKVMNRMKKEDTEQPKPVTVRACPECLSEIPIAAKRCAHCSSPVTSGK
jgi:large conductance mechanosensitive channel